MATWAEENRFTVQINGDALASLRISARLTQRQIADAIGVSTASICQYENGSRTNVRPDVIERLARTLGTKLGREISVAELTIIPAEPEPAGVAP